MIGEIRQIISDIEHGVYDKTKNGECRGCGKCCSNLLPVSKQEIKIIQRYIKEHHIQEAKHLAPVANNCAIDLICPFMRIDVGKNKCTIYPVRPKICKYFMCNKNPAEEPNKFNAQEYFLIDVRKTFFGD